MRSSYLMKSCGSKSNTEPGISKSTTSFEKKYGLILSTQVAWAMNYLYLSTKKPSTDNHPSFWYNFLILSLKAELRASTTWTG